MSTELIAPSPCAQQRYVVNRIVGHTVAAVLFLWCLSGSLLLLTEQGPRLFLFSEVGYGDSYILYDVMQFQNTGVVYRDLSQPPYLPAQYSPLVYMFYSLPGRIRAWENPFLGPRLLSAAAFVLCCATVVSIVRALIPASSASLWGLLWVCSIGTMRKWIFQLRGDFPGVLFSLLAIRLLLTRARWGALLAGISAGLAMQFKITFVASSIAGALWLLARRQWKELAQFACAGTATSAGLYLFFWAYEPRMISQIMALSPGIVDVRGWSDVISLTLREPVVWLALSAVPSVASRARPRWALVLTFALTSFASAGLAILQAGASVNYFHEGLFAIGPLAVLGTFRLILWARRHLPAGLVLAGLLLFTLLPFCARDLYSSLRVVSRMRSVQARNEAFRATERVLRGKRIFSTVPRLALIDPAPPLMEPYLLSYMQRLGKFDPQPIFQRIRNGEFDVVITSQRGKSWRGIPHVGPDLRSAIMTSYKPHCAVLGCVLHLPRRRPLDDTLVQELARIGCEPVAGDRAATVPNS